MQRSSNAATADVIAKFPGPVILYPSKGHLVYLLLGGIVFFVGGIWSLKSGESSGLVRAATIGCVIMGGIVAPLSALSFLPSAAFLRLDGAGFEYANIFFRRQYIWSDVKDFGVWEFPHGNRMVSFKAPWRGHFFTHYLPTPYGGFTVDETAALMDSWRSLVIPSPGLNEGGQRIVVQAKRPEIMFSHVTPLQWVGIAIIGLSFVTAVIFFSLTLGPAEPTDPILSDHGPERIACDTKWGTLQQPDPGSYREFLQNCMEGKSGSP